MQVLFRCEQRYHCCIKFLKRWMTKSFYLKQCFKTVNKKRFEFYLCYIVLFTTVCTMPPSLRIKTLHFIINMPPGPQFHSASVIAYFLIWTFLVTGGWRHIPWFALRVLSRPYFRVRQIDFVFSAIWFWVTSSNQRKLWDGTGTYLWLSVMM